VREEQQEVEQRQPLVLDERGKVRAPLPAGQEEQDPRVKGSARRGGLGRGLALALELGAALGLLAVARIRSRSSAAALGQQPKQRLLGRARQVDAPAQDVEQGGAREAGQPRRQVDRAAARSGARARS
jgi:hypothetical protein